MNQEVRQKVASLIDSYGEDYTRLLKAWVNIPSVKADPAPGAPFGPEARRMLDAAMADARALGFDRVRNVDGYACDITIGDAQETVAVLGHLDVVPAGDGWTRPPFEATQEGDRIYGRGTGDDKGPALASLMAMRAIQEAGVPLRRAIRLILGCDEESGSEDMAYYRAQIGLPELGFSPDAFFPVINTEKGILQLTFRAPDESASGLRVNRMAVGERMNVIPGEGRACLAGGEDLARRVRDIAQKQNLPFTAEVTPEGVEVFALGIAGHSAYPEGRRNAIGMLLLLFEALGAQGPLATLAGAVGLSQDGRGLDCACEDEVSGPLTCNLGILRLQDGVWQGTLDLRCPVTADQQDLLARVRAHLPGFTIEVAEQKEPHHVPADSELVVSLLAAYEEETGWPGSPQSTGGGNYA